MLFRSANLVEANLVEANLERTVRATVAAGTNQVATVNVTVKSNLLRNQLQAPSLKVVDHQTEVVRQDTVIMHHF